MLLKAASLLTSLIKSKNIAEYIEHGFDLNDMRTEVVSLLKEGSTLEESALNELIAQLDIELPSSVECLLDEQLIKEVDNKFFISDKALDLADFMLSLSSIMASLEQPSSEKQFPFRNYPGSSDVYGLN